MSLVSTVEGPNKAIIVSIILYIYKVIFVVSVTDSKVNNYTLISTLKGAAGNFYKK